MGCLGVGNEREGAKEQRLTFDVQGAAQTRTGNIPPTAHKQPTNSPSTAHQQPTNSPQTAHKQPTNSPYTFIAGSSRAAGTSGCGLPTFRFSPDTFRSMWQVVFQKHRVQILNSSPSSRPTRACGSRSGVSNSCDTKFKTPSVSTWPVLPIRCIQDRRVWSMRRGR